MDTELKCTSCNLKIANLPGSAKFKCPKCGQTEIIRCAHCRKIVAKYICPACSFSGPN